MFHVTDLDKDENEVEYPEFSIEEFKKNLHSFKNEKLCTIIASSNALKLNKDTSTLCMQELASRRIKGENFDFEGYIEQLSSTFPKVDLTPPSLLDIIGALK
jgi:hypothetical protein